MSGRTTSGRPGGGHAPPPRRTRPAHRAGASGEGRSGRAVGTGSGRRPAFGALAAGAAGRRVTAGSLAALAVALVPTVADAAELSLDLGGGSTSAQIVRFVLLLTGLALVPGLLVCITSFTRIVVVLSFLRSAIGLQQAPPNMVLISLALFLTGFVMAPVLQQSWESGIQPLLEERIDEETALARAAEPLARFMLAQVRDKDLGLFLAIAGIEPPDDPQAVPYRVLVPAFVISELRRAFEIGFLVFLPFLVIDMVVASILMSMGMMMVPPQTVSLPFKLIFFVLVDGWYLLAGSLVQSFVPVP